MSDAIRRADPRYRRGVFLLAVVLAILGAAIVFWFKGLMGDIVALAETDPAAAIRRTHRVFVFLMAFLGVGLASFGAYLLIFGVRVLRTGEMPPPGTRVLRDVPVKTGRPAAIRARIILVLAGLLLLGGLIVPWWMERQFRMTFDIPAVYQRVERPLAIPGTP